MANVVEAEPRNSQEWFGSYLNEDGIVADVIKRVSADAVAVKRWLDPKSWKFPMVSDSGDADRKSDTDGCLLWAGMSIRNFYGLWHADNPHTAFSIEDDVQIEDGIITDKRHPDNMSGRIVDRVKKALADLVVPA
jgi:hypothetical protein